MPTQQIALLITSKQAPFEIGTRDVPQPGPGQLLVKVVSAALNPVDYGIQTLGLIVTKYPAVIGSDVAGIVEEIGPGVTEFGKGDKVLHPGGTNNSDQAAYQHYSLISTDLAAKIPDGTSLDQASTIPLCLNTAAVGIYNVTPRGLGITPAWQASGRGKYTGQPFFVYGGSTGVGQFAIQLAKLSGFSPIISTASLHNTDLLRSVGATHVIDRHLPPESVVQEVKKITSEPLKYAYHAVMDAETYQVTYDVVASGGGIAWVVPDAQFLKVKQAENKEVQFVFIVASHPDNRKLTVSLYAALTSLIQEGSIKPTHVEVVPDGLMGIPAAVQRVGQKQISGKKLVAHPQETV